jgi:hypothetical protein
MDSNAFFGTVPQPTPLQTPFTDTIEHNENNQPTEIDGKLKILIYELYFSGKVIVYSKTRIQLRMKLFERKSTTWRVLITAI